MSDKATIIAQMIAMDQAAEAAEGETPAEQPASETTAADATAPEKPAAEKPADERAKGAEWKRVRDAQRAVKQREAQLAAREEQLQAQVRERLSGAERARELLAEGRPLDALDVLGVDRAALMAQLEKLAEGHDPKVEALRARQRQLEEQLAEREARERAEQQQQATAAQLRAAQEQVSTALRASDDPLTKQALEVVGERYERAVFAELKRAAAAKDPAYDWDDNDAVLREANSRVITNARSHYEQLVKLFSGAGSGPAPAVAGSSSPRSATGKPQNQQQPQARKGPLTPREALRLGEQKARELAGRS